MQRSISQSELWLTSFQDAQELLGKVARDPDFIAGCVQLGQWLTQTFQNGNHLLTCGNGGSHCDAMHFAEELTGRYQKDRRPLGAIALGESSHTTCVGNDYGFEQVFARQVEGLGRAGDLFVGISTSGNSKNVILALEAAQRKKMRTVALLGRNGGKLKGLADLAIVVPSEATDRIQEVHIKIIHNAIQACERELFPENYRK
jgi:D-sedoheptulose 7-phosphate isomerase